MGTHLDKDGQFQSDKYPTCPPGKVPLSVKDPTAQDLLWTYAQRRRLVDAEFSADLETALKAAGFAPPADPLKLREALEAARRKSDVDDPGRPVPHHGSGPASYQGRQWTLPQPHPAIAKASSFCRASRDGECNWKACPQRKVYRKSCPLPSRWEDRT